MAAKANGPKMPAPRPAKPAAVPAVALMRPYLSQQNEQNKDITYEVWKFCVSSCFSSPAGFMVKILETGIPTAL